MIPRAFEWLFGSPPVAFGRGELALGIPWPAFATLAALVGLGVFFLLGYRRTGRRLRAGERLLLVSLRAGAISLVLLCLFRPQLVLSLVVPQENLVGVLLDDSASMRIEDAGDGGERRGDVAARLFPDDPEDAPDELGPVLSEQFVTRLFRFAESAGRIESAGELAFRGSRTDLAGALRQAADELASAPLAGLVVLTDGADTVNGVGGGSLEQVLLDLRARGVRVYPVAIGQSEFETDVELGRVAAPARALRGALLELEVPLRAHGLAGRSARVEVLDEGRIIAAESVRFAGDRAEVGVTVLAPVEEAGARRLRFRVAPFPGESLTRNNERSVLLTVEDRELDLLYFEGQPRWEMKFARRAVADDPELRVATLLRTADGKFYRVDVSDAEELAGGFPDTREELFRYAGVVLGSVEASFFTKDQLDMLRDLVSQRGGGLLTLGGGEAYAEGGYRDTPVAEILPLVLPPPGKDRGGEGPALRELRVAPTRAGVSHPVVRLDRDSETNRERYRTLPALSSVHLPAQPKPGATVLLEGESGDGEVEPVLAVQRFGRGRVASLTVQDLWLWQMDAAIAVEDETHELLWRRLLRWLAADSPRRVEVAAEPANALVGESVTLRARASDEHFLAVNNAVVEAVVEAPDGRTETLPLRWTGQGDGEYSGSLQADSAGIYRVEVRAGGPGLVSGDAEAPPGAETWFEAGSVNDEFFEAEADPDLLSRIASATGGRVYDPDEANRLALDLSIAETGATVIERRELWNVPAMFLLLFGFLAGEWCLRQARGLR